VIESTLPSNPLFAIAVIIGIGILGGIASVVRASATAWKGLLPWGTILVNTIAVVFIGFWFAFYPAESSVAWVSALLVAGFAGGLSTFSTMAGELVGYFQRGRMLQMIFTAAGNIFIPLTGLLVITASF
jgi:CrcB protein